MFVCVCREILGRDIASFHMLSHFVVFGGRERLVQMSDRDYMVVLVSGNRGC